MSKFLATIHRHFITSEIVSFSERTLSWIISSARSHMIDNDSTYSFDMKDVKIANEDTKDMKTLITCSDEATSQWYIHKMIALRHYIHSFTKPSSNFDYLSKTFRLSPDKLSINSNILRDNNNNIQIEKVSINELDHEWINNNNYNEYFDIIIDEKACHNMLILNIEDMEDTYIETTIYGMCLKKSGIIYVVDRKINGDIAGIELRKKIGKLYPNTHFELISERDTPWTTQYIFLKVESFSNWNTERDATRMDVWGDGHREYAKNAIHDNIVMKNAGRNMTDGEDAVLQKLGVKVGPKTAPGGFGGGFD